MFKHALVLFGAMAWMVFPGAGPATPDDSLPIVVPTPQQVKYSNDLIEITGLTVDLPSDVDSRIKEEVEELKEELGFKDSKDGNVHLALKLDAGKESSLGKEGYSLHLSKDGDKIKGEAAAATAQGLFYSLQSLALLCTQKGSKWHVRPAEITDFPHWPVRGMIVGASQKEDLQFMKRYKLNALMNTATRHPTVPEKVKDTVKAMLERCHRYFVDFIALEGYKDMLSGQKNIEEYYTKRTALGIRALTVNFDDLSMGAGQGRSLAQKHADITMRAYKAMKAADKDVKVIFCPTPYGGTPDRGFVFTKKKSDGIDYLNLIGDQLPKDIEIFWTGDSVFATKMDAAMADSFGGLIKRKPFIWENTSIRWCNSYKPLSARSKDLYKHASGFLANVNESETLPKQDIALSHPVWITMADYLWNSEAYDPGPALGKAFLSLVGEGHQQVETAWRGKGSADASVMSRIRAARFRKALANKMK